MCLCVSERKRERERESESESESESERGERAHVRQSCQTSSGGLQKHMLVGPIGISCSKLGCPDISSQ